MEPILIDRHISAIVSRCSHWRDPEDEQQPTYFEPPEMQNLIVEPNPDGGVFIVATDGHILCRGTDSQGFTPVKGPVFVKRPEIPEGYGFDNVRSYQIKIDDLFRWLRRPGKENPEELEKIHDSQRTFQPHRVPDDQPTVSRVYSADSSVPDSNPWTRKRHSFLQ